MLTCCSGKIVIEQSEIDVGKMSPRPVRPETPAAFGGVEAVFRAIKDDGKYQLSKNKIRTWSKHQDVYTLHKPVRYKFTRNGVVVGSIDKEWEADFAIMESLCKENNGYKYLLLLSTYCQFASKFG